MNGYARRIILCIRGQRLFSHRKGHNDLGLFVRDLKDPLDTGFYPCQVRRCLNKDVIMLCLEDFKGKTLPVQPEIIGIKRLELAI
jgi:hypothetical protein